MSASREMKVEGTYVSVTARLAGAADTARAERTVAATANFMLIIKLLSGGVVKLSWIKECGLVAD